MYAVRLETFSVSRLLPQRRLIWKWTSNVIHEYRKVLDEDPRNVRSVRELPFEKEHIKVAVKLALVPYVLKGLHNLTRDRIG